MHVLQRQYGQLRAFPQLLVRVIFTRPLSRLAYLFGIGAECARPGCHLQRVVNSPYCLRCTRDHLAGGRGAVFDDCHDDAGLCVASGRIVQARDASELRRRLRSTERQNVVTPFRGGQSVPTRFGRHYRGHSLVLDSLAEISRGPALWT